MTSNCKELTCKCQGKKLTLVSIVVRGYKFSAFIYKTPGPITQKALHEMFPVLYTLPRGATYSIG